MTTTPTSEKDLYETPQGRRHDRFGLTGPIILVTIGVIFLIGQFAPGWGASKTWPVLLIVIGVTKLLESVWSRRSMPRN